MKPVILEECELSGSKNHLVYTTKVDINDTTQKKGIKGLINAELKKNTVFKRAFSVRKNNRVEQNSRIPSKNNSVSGFVLIYIFLSSDHSYFFFLKGWKFRRSNKR